MVADFKLQISVPDPAEGAMRKECMKNKLWNRLAKICSKVKHFCHKWLLLQNQLLAMANLTGMT